MALRAVVEGLKSAANEMERLSQASQGVAEINNGGGGGGGPVPGTAPSGPQPAPIRLTFVSNITTQQAPAMSSGGGSGSLNPANSQSDEFINFLRTRGIYDIQKANEQTIKALKQEFEFILRKLLGKSGGLDLRKMGMG